MPDPSGMRPGREGLSAWMVRRLSQAGKGGPSGDVTERGSFGGPPVAGTSLGRDASTEPPT